MGSYMKITAMSEGRNWSPETSPARNWNPFSGSNLKSSYSYSAVKSSTMEDEFGIEKNDINYQRDDWFGDHKIGHDASGYGSKYQGFGNTPNEPVKKSQQNELLEGAVSSLSLGWSALSKSAVSAAGLAKDWGQVATQKATELSGSVSEKIKDGSLLSDVQTSVTGFASKAGEYGAKSLNYGQELFSQGSTADRSEKSGLIRGGGEVKSQRKQQEQQLIREESTGEWEWGEQPEIKGFQDYDDNETYGNKSSKEIFSADTSSWHTFEPNTDMNKALEKPTVIDSESEKRQSSSLTADKNNLSGVQLAGNSGSKKKSQTANTKRKTGKKDGKKKKDEDLLIDFGDGTNQDWNSGWDDAAWDILNK